MTSRAARSLRYQQIAAAGFGIATPLVVLGRAVHGALVRIPKQEVRPSIDPASIPCAACALTKFRDEARAMLAEIYGWFTEGFGTRDPEVRQGAARPTKRITA